MGDVVFGDKETEGSTGEMATTLVVGAKVELLWSSCFFFLSFFNPLLSLTGQSPNLTIQFLTSLGD